MTKTALHEVKAWHIRVPAWSAQLVMFAGIIVLALAGVAGIGLMLVMSLPAAAIGAASLMRNRQKFSGHREKWPPQNRKGRAPPPVIEGEYEVIAEASSPGPKRPNTEPS